MSRRAFAFDATAQTAGGAVKALWWGVAGVAARSLARTGRTAPPTAAPTAEPAPEGLMRRAWLEAFEKDARDVARGLYPAMDDRPADPLAALRRALDLVADAREVEARRARGGAVEARDLGSEASAYPAYYRQNFHFQTGGWLTAESARRYEAQVEALFSGAAGAMRRRALALPRRKLARARPPRPRHPPGQATASACGSGGFLSDLARTFPRARLFGVDLSEPSLDEARRRARAPAYVQAAGARRPVAGAGLDAATSIYLFHELPPKVRPAVAREIARVLKPGGFLAFADSIQPADAPGLERLLQVFPAYFHEPYFADYAVQDLTALFAAAGLVERARDTAFLTKAILFEKVA